MASTSSHRCRWCSSICDMLWKFNLCTSMNECHHHHRTQTEVSLNRQNREKNINCVKLQIITKCQCHFLHNTTVRICIELCFESQKTFGRSSLRFALFYCDESHFVVTFIDSHYRIRCGILQHPHLQVRNCHTSSTKY